MTTLNLAMVLLGVWIGFGMGRFIGYKEGSKDERTALVLVIKEMGDTHKQDIEVRK